MDTGKVWFEFKICPTCHGDPYLYFQKRIPKKPPMPPPAPPALEPQYFKDEKRVNK